MEIEYIVLNPETENNYSSGLIENIFKNFNFTRTYFFESGNIPKTQCSISIFDNGGNGFVSNEMKSLICTKNSSVKILLAEDNSVVVAEIVEKNEFGLLFVLPSYDFVPLIYIINMVDTNYDESSKLTLPDFSDRKRVLLISPKGWQKVSVNLGLALLSGALKKVGFEVLILDLCYDSMSDEEISKKADEFDPFIIGLSVKTSQAKEAFRVTNLLKQNCPDTIFVAGGPHVTLDSDFFFSYQKNMFDFCIMSEGEVAFTSLALSLAVEDRTFSESIEGVVYKDSRSQKVVVNKWMPPPNISILPYPDFDSIYNFKTDNFCYPIVSSRGCPYSCIYCCVNLLTGSKKWRCRTPESIVNEIVYAKAKYNITQFEFWDDNFTLDMDRAKAFCRLLIETGLSLSWWCHNGIRADKVDEELALLMYRAGCTSVAFGIESGTDKVFNSIKKGEKLEDCVKAVNILKKTGIKAVGYFILGLPADTLDSFIDTIKFQRKLKLDHYTFGLLVPYPGTEVYEIIKSNGRILNEAINTQHFGADIPEITFDLPNFPKHDIFIAYYLTKYFELFEVAQIQIQKNSNCKIAFMIEQKEGLSSLIGLFYSLYQLKSYVSIVVYYNGNCDDLKGNTLFNQVSSDFEWGLISIINGDFEINVESFFSLVFDFTYSQEIQKIPNSKKCIKFLLQKQNPIENLKRVIN